MEMHFDYDQSNMCIKSLSSQLSIIFALNESRITISFAICVYSISKLKKKIIKGKQMNLLKMKRSFQHKTKTISNCYSKVISKKWSGLTYFWLWAENVQMKVTFLIISRSIISTMMSLISRSFGCVLRLKPFYANHFPIHMRDT